MHPEIPKLLQLQERDQRIRALQKDLKDVPRHEAAAKTQLAGDTAAVEAATLKVKEIEVKIKGVELDIQTRRNTIKRLGDQQFETRKNDEFQALGVEIQRYEADVRTLEDKELEHMEELETAKAVLKEAQGKLALTQGRVNEELKALAERADHIGAITASVETERRSLARELHDDTIQALIALNQRIQLVSMNASEPQKVSFAEIQELVQQSMSNLRRMIRGLRPIYLEDLGLVASLEMLVREMEQASTLSIDFSAKGAERRLDAQSEMSLYRMVQESLNNVVHHASADHAWVELQFTELGCSIQIRDDGKGFVVPDNPGEFPKRGHFGLLGLHERAELIGAELKIDSKPGNGTTIRIGLSIPAQQKPESNI